MIVQKLFHIHHKHMDLFLYVLMDFEIYFEILIQVWSVNGIGVGALVENVAVVTRGGAKLQQSHSGENNKEDRR